QQRIAGIVVHRHEVVQRLLDGRGAAVVGGDRRGHHLGVGVNAGVVLGIDADAATGGDRRAVVDPGPGLAAYLVARQHATEGLAVGALQRRGIGLGGVAGGGIELGVVERGYRNVAVDIHRGAADVGMSASRLLTIECLGNQRVAEYGVDGVEQDVLRLPADAVER